MQVLDDCSWNNPGSNAYYHSPATAVATYPYPEATKKILIDKMNRRVYDDLVVIDAKGIYGLREYTNLRNMHFGKNTVCKNVDRSKWGNFMTRGLVYCAHDNCLIVPFICKNVAEVTQLNPKAIYPDDSPYWRNPRPPVTPPDRNKVPLPSSLWLVLLALAGVLFPWKKRK